MANASNAIEIHGLKKRFGSFEALRGLDLEVAEGEVHGFLGPNGAGKSTTIRVLLGLLKADGGSVRLLGGDPWSDVLQLHKRLAYVPGDVSLWPGMSGGEAIDFLGNLRGGLDPKRRKYFIDRFDLDTTKKGRQYSKGNRQKVALVAAFALDVELLILDEPTSGLDPLMEAIFQEEVAAAATRGTTVLLSSHIMSEVETLTDRVTIIRKGQTARTGTISELRQESRTTIRATLDTLPQDMQEISGLHDAEIRKDNEIVGVVYGEDLGKTMSALSRFGIQTLAVEPPSLEELFLDVYSEGK